MRRAKLSSLLSWLNRYNDLGTALTFDRDGHQLWAIVDRQSFTIEIIHHVEGAKALAVNLSVNV